MRPGLVFPRRRALVAQAERESQLRGHLPGVVDVQGETVGAELRLGDRDRRLGLIELAQQEAGEGIAAGLGERVLRGLQVERPLAASELVAHLVVLVAADFAAEAEGVLAANDGSVVEELQRVVLVLVRAFGIVADAAVVDQRYVGHAPLHGRAAGEARDLELIDYVAAEGEQASGRVVEAGVAEAGLGDHGGRDGAGIGADVLLHIGQNGRTVQVQALGQLVLIAPAITAEPGGFGRFLKVHAENELVLVDGASLRSSGSCWTGGW